jgi:glutaredoxin
MQAPLLELYFFESCPYCQRVLNVIQKHNLKVTFLDIYENTNHMQKLMMITGKKTVPCLFIDGQPMFESLDIMAWMENNLAKLAKNA